MADYYILEGKTPVPCDDREKWELWLRTADRTVRQETVGLTPDGEVNVRTVFVGLDHSFGGGPPLVFESMIFGGPLDQEQSRCSTWEGAEEMHERMVEKALASVSLGVVVRYHIKGTAE